MGKPMANRSETSGTELRSSDEQLHITEQNRMNIVQLNYDCLKHIFQYLYTNDFVNLAVASSAFREAAIECYKRATHRVGTLIPSFGKDNAFNENIINHFNHVINDLSIIARNDFDIRLLDLIVKHCGRHLTALSVRIDHVTRLSKNKKIWAKFFDEITINFPYLQYLSYSGNSVKPFRNINRIIHSFPYLIQLSVDLHGFSMESFKEIIRLNPQLMYLTISFYDLKVTSDLMEFIDENLVNLTYLCLQGAKTDPPTETTQKHRFKHLNELSLYNCSDFRLEDIFDILSISGDKLETLNCCNMFTMARSAFKHILRCKNLKKLHIFGLTDADMMEIAKKLPLLEMIYMYGHSLSKSEIRRTLEQFPKLKKVYISRVFKDEHSNEIAKQLKSSDWKVTGLDDECTIEKLDIQRSRC